jgi:hypothetical protein
MESQEASLMMRNAAVLRLTDGATSAWLDPPQPLPLILYPPPSITGSMALEREVLLREGPNSIR